MKLNKEKTTAMILSLAEGQICGCTKLPTENIVFPKWSEIGLWGEILALRVKTKEQPKGCDYDETKFQVVMRIIKGKVRMTGGRPDAYAWKFSKVEPYLQDPKNLRLIGVNSAKAVINLSAMLNTIDDEEDRVMFADMFCSINKDLLLIPTDAEDRQCIEVTKELYENGVTACVDSWMEPDENGEADATRLNIGDFLVMEGEYLYCIRRDEFLETHEMK